MIDSFNCNLKNILRNITKSKMKQKAVIITIFIINIFLFNSCKKGEEDPWLSLRSRESRLIGKWKLEEKVYSYKYKREETSTNNVNTESEIYNYTKESNERTIDGIKTYTSNLNRIITTKETFFDVNINSYSNITTKETYNSEYTEKNKNTIEIEIFKNKTWKATYHNNKISYSQRSTITTELDTSINVEESESNIDTTYTSGDMYTTSEKGTWEWDDSNDNKIIIKAGPMYGNIKRLTNKEIIIERKIKESSEINNYFDRSFYVFDDINNSSERRSGILSKKELRETEILYNYQWVSNE